MRKWATFAAWCFFCIYLSAGYTTTRPLLGLALIVTTLLAAVLLIANEVLR